MIQWVTVLFIVAFETILVRDIVCILVALMVQYFCQDVGSMLISGGQRRVESGRGCHQHLKRLKLQQ
jgi:hypothetical protein